MKSLRSIAISKLATFRTESNQGPMTYDQWKSQRTNSARQLLSALPGPIHNTNTFEIHPYQNKYQPLMPKNPACYIIGTAPPSSYLRAGVPGGSGVYEGPIEIDGKFVGSAPQNLFYHGNKGSFWRAIGFQENSVEDILGELNRLNVRYDDICFSWSRKDFSSPSDKQLTDIVPNIDLLEDIWKRNDRPVLWFTNSGVFVKSGIKLHRRKNQHGTLGQVLAHGDDLKAYNLFLRTWQELGAQLSVRASSQDEWKRIQLTNAEFLAGFGYKTRHELRIEFEGVTREYPVLSGPSPAGQSNLQLVKHPRYLEWCRAQGLEPRDNVAQYKTHVYVRFLEMISNKREV